MDEMQEPGEKSRAIGHERVRMYGRHCMRLEAGFVSRGGICPTATARIAGRVVERARFALGAAGPHSATLRAASSPTENRLVANVGLPLQSPPPPDVCSSSDPSFPPAVRLNRAQPLTGAGIP